MLFFLTTKIYLTKKKKFTLQGKQASILRNCMVCLRTTLPLCVVTCQTTMKIEPYCVFKALLQLSTAHTLHCPTTTNKHSDTVKMSSDNRVKLKISWSDILPHFNMMNLNLQIANRNLNYINYPIVAYWHQCFNTNRFQKISWIHYIKYCK